MNEQGNEELAFEIGVVIPRRVVQEKDESCDCARVIIKEFEKVGFVVERVIGIADEFVKLAAPLETLGRAAAELQIKKRTHIGMDLQFEVEEVEAFVKQPDGSVFSWCERFQCYCHLIYGIVNSSMSAKTLKFDGKEIHWEIGENLLQKLESENIVKQVFPLHDEKKRKKLLRSWALHWWDFTSQPIDEIYSYYGAKIAIYFAFLGMYTRWLLFPAAFGLTLQFIDFGSLKLVVLPVFFIMVILWAVMFSQFWKRKNAALLARWPISSAVAADPGYKISGRKASSLQPPMELIKVFEIDKAKGKEVFQRYEWFGRLLRFRNDAIIIFSIICLQLPFELAYAHLYEVISSDIIKFGLTAVYLFAIQYITKIGGKVSVKLIMYENNENTEKRADSLVYKVFGLYFMQTYIGIFYHALLHRNFSTLRKVLIQRLLLSEVFENLLENSLPYLKYSYKKYRVRHKKKKEKGESTDRFQFSSRVEKEYLKPSYSASIGEELEDGLFDDFLELALQFGMILMFACAFPPAFAFAAVNNIMEIRTDALKLLAILRRPVPRAAATVGAWLNIFQFLIVMSICTNCALLAWLYDEEGKWKIEPGLAAILIMEHVLLLIKFGFSRLVPEEPAWVRANRAKHTTQAQDMCSKKLLRTISGGDRAFEEEKKLE
ncbi:anoctamin-like protein At1g73020 isoform X2 [Abrus precatorius]|uniref:Anoctamin-like protein At1g73020 isoform X2 n=1 Tax=Abrus precatorius TaxID=3816 RepID=A0A8B8JVN2_ABRPR|nr:anoctamin-like protein At1g73020 isoform X2 [Abrus precatorius]